MRRLNGQRPDGGDRNGRRVLGSHDVQRSRDGRGLALRAAHRALAASFCASEPPRHSQRRSRPPLPRATPCPCRRRSRRESPIGCPWAARSSRARVVPPIARLPAARPRHSGRPWPRTGFHRGHERGGRRSAPNNTFRPAGARPGSGAGARNRYDRARPRHAELLTQDLRNLRFRNQPCFDEHRTDAPPVALLGDQDLLELSTANNPEPRPGDRPAGRVREPSSSNPSSVPRRLAVSRDFTKTGAGDPCGEAC